MQKIKRSDLLSLEDYSNQRTEWRDRVMRHKKDRIVILGKYARLYFEDRLTMQYQIQEMLRVEKIFDADGIMEELEVYNALIPDGSNLKATFMLEYEDVDQRRRELAQLVGIENSLWLRIGDGAPIHCIANEDLERSTEQKTSSVHFLRFELPAEEIARLKDGATLTFGIDHEHYPVTSEPIPEHIHHSLVSDLG